MNIHPTASLHGSPDIDPTAEVYPYCCIGWDAEANPPKTCRTVTVIGPRATLREHVVVQRGFNRPTIIGAGCYLMHGVHVGHGVQLAEGCTLSPFAVPGGDATLLPHVTMGIHSATHQWVTVGACAMIGMGAMVIDDVPPCVTVVGSPARIVGLNRRGMEKHGYTEEHIAALTIAWEAARSGKRRAARERA